MNLYNPVAQLVERFRLHPRDRTCRRFESCPDVEGCKIQPASGTNDVKESPPTIFRPAGRRLLTKPEISDARYLRTMPQFFYYGIILKDETRMGAPGVSVWRIPVSA